MKQYLIYFLVSTLLAFMLLRPIMASNAWYPMHDSTSPARIILMKQTLLGGQLPAIWASGINHNLGYPLFHFYAPLFHGLSTLISLLISSTLVPLKLMLALSISVGSLGVMILAGRTSRLAGLVAGVAYALSPYGALNLYVRGAYAEYLGLALIPWVLLAFRRVTTWRQAILAGLALALFLLSHNLLPILVLPMILIWALYHNRASLKYLLSSLVIAGLLSAFYLLPLVFERSFVTGESTARTTNYQLHFVYPQQIWNSTWGYGGSGPGVEDGMSFKLGKIHLIFGLMGLLLAVIYRLIDPLLFAFFALVSLFLSTTASQVVWDQLSLLQLLQFPWRALGVATVFCALLAGIVVSLVKLRFARIVLTVASLLALFIFNYKYFVPVSIISPNLTDLDVASVVPEFMPIWLTRTNPLVDDTSTLPYAYYPTWQITQDGQRLKTHPSPDGLLSYETPLSDANIEVSQGHTLLESIASYLSLVTLLGVIYYFIRSSTYVKN